MHFKRKPMDAMLPRILRRLLPVGHDLLFPWPILHLCVLGRPAISKPVGLRVGRTPPRTTGESQNYFDVEFFGKPHSLAEGFRIAGCGLRIRMQWISVATKRGYPN